MASLSRAWKAPWRLAVAGAAALAAMAAPAQTLDLQQALMLARQADPGFQAARMERAALAEVVPQARAGLLPNAGFSASRNRVSLSREEGLLSSQSDYHSLNNTLVLRQPLWRRAQWFAFEQARAQAANDPALAQRAEADLLLRVASAYFDLLYAQQSIDVLEAVSAASRQQLAAARRALELGQGTRTDIDEAQARFDQAQAQGLQARQNQTYARRQLALLVGQEVAELRPLPIAQAQAPVLTGSLADWLERARARSPEWQLARSRLAVAGFEVDRAQAGHEPTLDLVAQRAISKNENTQSPQASNQSSQLGVQLSLPLFAGGGTSAAVRQAVANREREQFLLEQVGHDLSLKVQREYHALVEGPERLQAARQALHSAAQLAVSTAKGMQAGTRTMVDRLNAVQREAEARRELALVHYQLQLSRLKLAGLTGEDLAPVVQALNQQLQP